MEDSVPAQLSDIPRLMDDSKKFYDERGRSAEFEAELPIYRALFPPLLEKMSPNYGLASPIGLGSTATVWKIFDIAPNQPRALKLLPRPSKSQSAEIVRIIRGEPLVLSSLNHQNIIKVFTYGEVGLEHENRDYHFPYFVMEFLEHRADLDQAIVFAKRDLDWVEIIDYFRDALSGIAALPFSGDRPLRHQAWKHPCPA